MFIEKQNKKNCNMTGSKYSYEGNLSERKRSEGKRNLKTKKKLKLKRIIVKK